MDAVEAKCHEMIADSRAIDYDNDDRAVEDLAHSMLRADAGELLEWIPEHGLTLSQVKDAIRIWHEFQDARDECDEEN